MDLRAAQLDQAAMDVDKAQPDPSAMDVDKAQLQPGALDMHKAQIQPDAMDVDEAQVQEALNLAKLALGQAKSAWMVVSRKRRDKRGDSDERIREDWQDAKANVEDLEKRLYHIRGGNSHLPAKPKGAVQTRRTAKSSPSSLAASVIQNGISSISSSESSDTVAPVIPMLNDQEISGCERQIETDGSSILVDNADQAKAKGQSGNHNPARIFILMAAGLFSQLSNGKNISDDETDVLASQGAKILDHETVVVANGSAVSKHQVEADRNLLAVDGIKGITNEEEEAMKISDDETRVPASKRDASEVTSKAVVNAMEGANIQGSGSQPEPAAFQFPPLHEIIQSLNESVKGHSTDTTVGPSLHFPEAQTLAAMIFKGVNPSASPPFTKPAAPAIDPKLLSVAQPPEQVMNMDTDAPDSTPYAPQEFTKPAAPTIDPKLLSVAQPPEQVMNMDTDAPDSMPSAPQESTSAAIASGSPDDTAIQSSDSCKSPPAETVSEIVWPAFGQRAFTGVDAKTIKEIHSTLAMRENHLQVIHEAEFNLCLPQQRTMADIRAQISFIDRGYRYVNDAEIRLEELRQVVLKIEADSEAKAARKVLLDQRRRLTKEKESLLKVMADKANAEVMLKVTDIVKQLIELDRVLNPPRATKATKSSNAEKKGGKRLDSVGTGDDIGNFKSDLDERKAVESFNNMTPEQKTDMAAKARDSIHAYMRSGLIADLNVGHRQELRVIQGLLPDESLRSTTLAISIHTTSAANTVCRFHKRYQKTRIHDSAGLNVVEGVGYPAVYGSLQNPVVPPDGFMNCGCLIEDVLYDFYFWKTWTATARRPDLANHSESLKYDVLPPRIRAFVVDMFKKFTRLTLNDLYGCYGMSRTAREDMLAMVSAKRLIEGWKKSTGVGVTFEIHGNSSAKVEDVGDN